MQKLKDGLLHSYRSDSIKEQAFQITRYDADEGMCFDWVEPRFIEDEEGNQIQEHLYATTLFIGGHDSIENYIEVEKPEE